MDSDLDRAPGGLPVPGALEDGLLVVDGDRKILWCNPALARMFGLQPEEVPGMNLLSLFDEHLLPVIEDEASARSIRQALLDGADLPDLC
ncbi:MAG TPA: PAS domain-containing protein, partial [Methanoculleus sp.]|nr:PAS domain-containing protein [Methanoculleus sp.]